MSVVNGTVDVALVPKVEPTEIAQPDRAVSMFERLAMDPNVDVEKLERLIAMQERIMRHNAEAAFNVAFAQLQPAIPTIAERGKTDKTTYAPREDIVDVVRPLLSEHGFTLSFRTEWPDKKSVRVIGVLTHNEGHSRTSEFLSDADQTGSKNAIQALGSAVEYGRRYTTTDLLNIVTRKGADDDGERATDKSSGAPDGYEDWLADLTSCADEGWPKLSQAFGKSKDEYRKFLTKYARGTWDHLKTKAEAATKAGRL